MFPQPKTLHFWRVKTLFCTGTEKKQQRKAAFSFQLLFSQLIDTVFYMFGVNINTLIDTNIIDDNL